LVDVIATLCRTNSAWRFVLLALALAVGVLALIPSLPPRIGTGWDKLNHIIAFAALAVAACRGFSGSPKKTSGALLGVLAFGVAIEALQLLVGRTASRGDLLADALGTGAGALVALVIWPAMRRMCYSGELSLWDSSRAQPVDDTQPARLLCRICSAEASRRSVVNLGGA
jgi:VanZ family protein